MMKVTVTFKATITDEFDDDEFQKFDLSEETIKQDIISLLKSDLSKKGTVELSNVNVKAEPSWEFFPDPFLTVEKAVYTGMPDPKTRRSLEKDGYVLEESHTADEPNGPYEVWVKTIYS